MSNEATFWRMEAERHARYACPVCRDTGIVQCPEPDGTGMYETACPEPVHDGQPCPVCSDRGYVEGPGCNCGVGPAGYYGMHERYCGLEPCPRGCPFIGPVTSPPSDVTPTMAATEE